MKNWILLLAIALMATLTAVGCANPADDAPKAEVEESATETNAEAVETNAEAGALYAITPDNGSTVSWVGSKVTGSHDGGFENFEGELMLTDGTPEGSKVNVTIDTTSLWSDNDSLTEHLKSADFFAVEAHPTATFKSTAITANDAGGYQVAGDLTLHGITKKITFPASIETSGDKVAVASEFSIKRFDWDIVYKGKADDLIRDEVLIKLNLIADAGTVDATEGDATAETTEDAA